jgi:RNA polymerase sigma-70 factor (ECF subfamily)
MSSVSPLNALELRQLLPALTHDAVRAPRNFSLTRRPNVGHMKNTDDDSECMARLAAGDSHAVHQLYQRHGRALLRFSSAMCRSRQAAEDMVHDTFLALMRERISFDPAQGSVFGYLCGVLRHRVSRHFRQQRRWVALNVDDDSSQVHAVESSGPADEIARSEITAAFRRVMLELPLQHREVIALCDLEELSYATVACILDCPVGTVRSRLHRARALLTLRLASLELIDLAGEPMTQRGLT